MTPQGDARTEADVARAAVFIAGTHHCDRQVDLHPHKGCYCSCGLCFAFWHYNIWRYEQAEKIVSDQ